MKNSTTEDHNMKTLVSCTNMLDKLGFTSQFTAQSSGLQSLNSKIVYKPSEVKIVNFYRFEGNSNPSDNAILYAIETKNGEKGTLTDAYGPYSNTEVVNFLDAIGSVEKRSNK